MKEELRNAETYAYFDGEKISGRDLTDPHNLPCCFSLSKRGIKKAWESLKCDWTAKITMDEMEDYLENHKIKMHYYYAMD